MKKKFIFVLLIVLLIGGAVIFYISTPDFMLKSYVKAYINEDFEKMYSLTKVYDELTNKNSYVSACKENYEKINDYDIEIRDNYALLSYDDKTIKIKYEKNPDVFLGINRYYITEGFIEMLTDLVLYVPIGSEDVTLNGTSLKEYKVETDSVIYDKYELPYLYDCNHNLKGKYSEIEYEESLTFNEDEELTYEFKNDPVEIMVFTLDGCKYCNMLLEYYNILALDYDDIFDIKKLDYMNSENVSLMKKYTTKYDDSTSFPLSIIGDGYIQGYSEDLENEYLFKIFDAYRKNID